MPKNDIGGFFVSLGMKIDKNSFETGNKLVDGMGNAFNKLIGSARNAAVVLATTAVATGAVESAAYKTSAALGITTEALDTWKASAKIAGVNAEALVSSISKISGVQSRIKYDGSGLQALQVQLDKLHMSYSEIQNLSADKATQKILEKAQSMLNGSNMSEISAYVEDILGTGARDFLIEADRQKMSIAALLGRGQSTVFTTAADNQKGATFSAEANALKTELQSMSKLFGDSVAGALTDTLKDLNSFITEHGDDIAEWIRTVGENVAKLVNKLVGDGKGVLPTVVSAGKAVGSSILDTATGVVEMGKAVGNQDGEAFLKAAGETANAAIVEPTKKIVSKISESSWATGQRDKQTAEAAIRNYVKAAGYTGMKGAFSDLPYEQLPDELKAEFDKYATKSFGHYHFAGAVKDGIISPNGTVTQVAPDDWVFAARNLGDMARAFIPQNYNNVSAPSEYSIVQNFTINGASDMPQVLRQQAYKGTQDGLLELMQQSSRRLQLMSGTR